MAWFRLESSHGTELYIGTSLKVFETLPVFFSYKMYMKQKRISPVQNMKRGYRKKCIDKYTFIEFYIEWRLEIRRP